MVILFYQMTAILESYKKTVQKYKYKIVSKYVPK